MGRIEKYLNKEVFIRLLLLSGNERQLRNMKDISSEEIEAVKATLGRVNTQ